MKNITKNLGFTLTEALIALAIFSTVLALSSGAIVNSLGTFNREESKLEAQAKMRRVTEIVSQELRSALFGGIADAPYTSGSEQVSFYLLEGGAGFPIASTTNNSLEIVTNADPGLGRNAVVVDGATGSARLIKIKNVQQTTGSSIATVNIQPCNSIVGLSSPLLFNVRTLGYQFDPATKKIFQTENGTANDLAFDVSNLRIDYVYSTANGDTLVKNAPEKVSGVPAKFYTHTDGSIATLTELRLNLETEVKLGGGKTLTRSYTAPVSLLNTSTNFSQFTFQGVSSC